MPARHLVVPLAPLQQRGDHRGLAQREQPADLEPGGERQVLATVGDDHPKLVTGVGEEQPRSGEVRRVREQRSAVPRPDQVTSSGALVQADVPGLGHLESSPPDRLDGGGSARAEQPGVDVLHELLEGRVTDRGEAPAQ